MVEIHNNKIFAASLNRSLIQGENEADTITFRLFNSEYDYSGCSWRVRGTINGNSTETAPITPRESEEYVEVDWLVTDEFLGSAGTLYITLVGFRGEDEITKAIGSVEILPDMAMQATGEITRNLFEQLIAQVESLKEDSEAWAVGQRNGEDVPSTDPAYHNNAKWYAEHMQGQHNDLTGRDAENAHPMSAVTGLTEKFADYRTATEQDAIDATKADSDDVYGRTYLDSKFAEKADADSVYDKTETDTALALKADKTALAETDDSLKALWAFNKGQTYLVETDNATAYSKQIKSGVISEADKALINSIGGRSVCVNQLAYNGNFVSSDGWASNNPTYASLSISDRIATLTVTSTLSTFYNVSLRPNADDAYNVNGVIGHKYLISCEMLSPINANFYGYLFGARNFGVALVANEWKKCITIVTATADGKFNGSYFGLSSIDGIQIGDQLKFKNLFVTDITKWFGAGSEPSTTTDPKMAEVYAYLAEHPEYNAGIIKSAEVSEIESRSADDAVIGSIEIPESIKSLEGYGQSHESDVNTVDFESKVYRKKGYYSNGEWVSDIEDVDISALLPSNSLAVESGGSVTYKQTDSELQVPNSISYLRKASEVG